MTVSTELSVLNTEITVSYFDGISSEKDAAIVAVAETHGFKRNGSGAGLGSRDITFDVDGVFPAEKHRALSRDLLALGFELVASADEWGADDELLDGYFIVEM